MEIRSVNELGDLSGVRVLVRTALNVPMEQGAVSDTFRLDRALKTIEFLTARGARVILASHRSETTGSLKPVFDYLKKKIALVYVDDIAGVKAHAAALALKDGQSLMLENLRWDKGEKANDEHFVRELTSMADMYVDDDFTTAHRPHASIIGVPKFLPSYAGFQFLAELEGLTPALTPQSPSLAILGGKKLETKVPLLQTLLKKYDHVFVGGALANDFFLAKGYEIGKSLASGTDVASRLLNDSKILLPTEVSVATVDGRDDVQADNVGAGETISDIAPRSIAALKPYIDKARMILWNGPMGNFENGFREGTDILASFIAKAQGTKIVGGGDTLASIQDLGLEKDFTFVSTAGGAMLDFLANGTLPGIEALESSKATRS